MPDKKYEVTSSDSVVALGLYLKGKIPTVDSAVTESSSNAVSSAAVCSYVTEQISKIGGISFKKVDILPDTGDGKYIYLVPKSTSATDNTYDEYIWYNSAWELIGTTEMDLSDYIKFSDMHALTADEITEIMDAVWNS